jgi:hypothetical protein
MGANIESRLRKLEGSQPKSKYPGIPDHVIEDPKGFPPAEMTGEALCDWVRNVRPGREDVAGELAAMYLHAGGDVAAAIRVARGMPTNKPPRENPLSRADGKILIRAAELALRDREKALRRNPEALWPEIDEAFVAGLLKRAGFKPEEAS